MRILGIDPGLNTTGYGIVEQGAAGLRIVEAGTLSSRRQDVLPERILAIYSRLADILTEFAPDGMALEDLYTEYRFPRTALLMAHVRGAVCLAAAQAAVPVRSFAAREVKNAVVGYGNASKEQVQAMVQQLFRLERRPSPHDVADALALAVTGIYRKDVGLPGMEIPGCYGRNPPARVGAAGGRGAVIAYLKGKVLEFEENRVTLDVHGVGYEVMLPAIEMKTLRARLHRDNGAGPDEIALYIYYHVNERQPTPMLIGFTERQSREFFRALLTVAEVGPALAAKAMTIAVCEFASAIERRDVRMLGTLPGIGKRKADQIVATLKGKVLQYALLPAPEILELPTAAVAADFTEDVSAVLQGLGYKRVEAEAMIRRAQQRNAAIADAQQLLEEIWSGEKRS